MSGPNLHGTDLFGETIEKKHTSKLGDEFLIPPFSVLSAREGWWQDRKRAWLALGIQSELGRGENLMSMSEANYEYMYNKKDYVAKKGKPLLANGGGMGSKARYDLATPGGSKMPAADYSKSKARGDGRGRAIQ